MRTEKKIHFLLYRQNPASYKVLQINDRHQCQATRKLEGTYLKARLAGSYFLSPETGALSV